MLQDERLPIVKFFPTEQMPEYHNIKMSATQEGELFPVPKELAFHLLEDFPNNFKAHGRVAKQVERELSEKKSKFSEVKILPIDISELPPNEEGEIPEKSQ